MQGVHLVSQYVSVVVVQERVPDRQFVEQLAQVIVGVHSAHAADFLEHACFDSIDVHLFFEGVVGAVLLL